MYSLTIYNATKSEIVTQELEVVKLQEQLEQTEEYKKLQIAKANLEAIKKRHAELEYNLINLMLQNGDTEFEKNGVKVKLKDTSRDSVKIEDESLIPDEYKRTKVEINKSEILKAYRETGVLISGIDIVRDPKYKLEIKVDE
ncbi:hypothetical protein IX317_002137 [Fusobacterium sp. DD29]|uniref:siphovirus Gp157 family protein n=1 Tax=unclassified Fusobacterium TaxID=2648384 RepID=UPI001B8D802C|nr:MULTISPECIES: siphovirus Gp157 family protein [unclassified Fusobacterium]MBR8750415.1 hypothetical protein [Fusobacterium sp. DD29]MBR8762656.1 hypothetical protein [Fusobacterium sp. DD25]MBR8768687.1 hypothetical protein [Fusobacterium sp. DD43]MBR8772760.1 hypothetical protein [Fusobacterium sp. DD40]MBR8776969.1 hypothetical protein [Fusobacterium sp. DD17]